jgi:plastocyanin
MKIKLIVSLLILCLAFFFGLAQAQMGGDITSNNASQQRNLTTTGEICTLATVDKTINVSQQAGEDVKWIFPGPRRLDPQIFGTPDVPIGYEPEIGVPLANRSVSGNEFTTTSVPTPYSDNFTRINGSFNMNLTDNTPVDVNESEDMAEAEFNFTDPTGEIRYRVVLTNVTRVGQIHPVFGGVIVDGIAHGKTGIGTRLEPTSYLYGAFWGVGSLYVNDTLVSNNRVIHAMATERIRSPDQQGYRLLLDNELPHRGIQAHLLLPEKVMADNGTMQEQPVPTNYTLPGGENQTFIHIIFDDPQLEGLEILDFDNATAAMAENVTGMENITGMENMTGMNEVVAAGRKNVEVSINNFAFNPESVTISTGDTVRWTNLDSANHTATGSTFDSGILQEGESYEFQFTDAGTYEYSCLIHPSMRGSVIVEKK